MERTVERGGEAREEPPSPGPSHGSAAITLGPLGIRMRPMNHRRLIGPEHCPRAHGARPAARPLLSWTIVALLDRNGGTASDCGRSLPEKSGLEETRRPSHPLPDAGRQEGKGSRWGGFREHPVYQPLAGSWVPHPGTSASSAKGRRAGWWRSVLRLALDRFKSSSSGHVQPYMAGSCRGLFSSPLPVLTGSIFLSPLKLRYAGHESRSIDP